MKIAVVGATGLVGTEMLKVLAERQFPLTELLPVASAKSVGQQVEFLGKKYPVVSMDDAIAARPDIAIFSAGGSVSKEHAPRFAAVGTTVIDNSSAWRMDPDVPLIVPEVNAEAIAGYRAKNIIANPRLEWPRIAEEPATVGSRTFGGSGEQRRKRHAAGDQKARIQPEQLYLRQGHPVGGAHPHGIGADQQSE